MSARKSEHSERINVFFSTEVLNQLKEEAETNGMTVSGLIRMIVLKHLSAK